MPKTRSTLVMDEDLWKKFRMIAILNDMEISELVEQALREKLERMKQLEQYDSYKEVESLHVSKGTQSQQPRDSVIKFSVNLPRIEFPADKSKIIKYAKKANPESIITFVELISNREYKNKLDLENELSLEVTTTDLPQAREFIDKGGSIRFEIDDRELTREQNKERKLKQENQFKLMQST